MKNGNYNILGNEYQNFDVKPSIYNKIEMDKRFVSKNGDTIFSGELINNNLQTLYDATNGLKFISNNIYCNNLELEIKYMKYKKIDIDDLIKNGYILKYWPYHDQNIINKNTKIIIKKEKIKKG